MDCRRIISHLWRGRARPGQAGIIIVWSVFVLAVVAGLVVDAGAMFTAYRVAFNRADGAARAAVNELDQLAYRTGVVGLDPTAATTTAQAWLAPDTGIVRVLASPTTGAFDRVEVTVSREAPTYFMHLVGIPSWRVTATATQNLRFSP